MNEAIFELRGPNQGGWDVWHDQKWLKSNQFFDEQKMTPLPKKLSIQVHLAAVWLENSGICRPWYGLKDDMGGEPNQLKEGEI